MGLFLILSSCRIHILSSIYVRLRIGSEAQQDFCLIAIGEHFHLC